MLESAVAQTSNESNGRELSVETQRQHATRSTRNGPADVNYNQKWHPMDPVTRPKRASRITGSRAPSAFAETSDEDEPELSSGESTDGDGASEASDAPPMARMPDPRAVRQSSRSEAKKFVNYSRKQHPQDHSIPGYRGLTKRKRDSSASKPQKKKKSMKQSSTETQIVLSSDKTGDSDSDSESDGNEPPVNRPSIDAALSPQGRAESPDTLHVNNDDFDEQSPESGGLPPLPRNDSSFNGVDAIIKGEHIFRKERSASGTDESCDAYEPIVEDPDADFADASTKDITDVMGAMLEGVATPGGTNSDPASSEQATPAPLIIAPPSPIKPAALVTPISMGATEGMCTQAKTRLAINRPYMAAQPTPSHNEGLHKPEQVQPLNESSLKISTASTQLPTGSPSDEESPGTGFEDVSLLKQDQNAFSDASRQAMRDASEEAAYRARCRNRTHQLSSEASSQGQPSSKNSSTSAGNISRQVSRDTLPDEPNSSSFFEETMAGTQSNSQREYDDEPLRPSSHRYSQLPVSERECSDTSASQEPSGSDRQGSPKVDGGQFQPSVQDASTAQALSSNQIPQQQPQSSVTLPGSTNTEGQANSATQAAAPTYSEDSMLLQPSSA